MYKHYSRLTSLNGQRSVLLVHDITTNIAMSELSNDLLLATNSSKRHLFVFVDTLVFFWRAEPSRLSTGTATSVLLISRCRGTCLVLSGLSRPWRTLFRGHSLFLFARRPWRPFSWSHHHAVVVAIVIFTVGVSFPLCSESHAAISHVQLAITSATYGCDECCPNISIILASFTSNSNLRFT